jgi:hypothetical protein
VEVVVVSTHLDDAVLSAWSVLSTQRARVVTVFTGGPPPGTLTNWDADSGAPDSATRMEQRRSEDAAALALAGCEFDHLGLQEAQYGAGKCPPEALAPSIVGAEVVYAPAGIGEPHVNREHIVVRDAVLALRSDAWLYADQPYCNFSPTTELPGSARERALVTLPDELRSSKAEAIRLYAGELWKLERDFGEFARSDRLAYEVLWSP